MPKSSWLAFDEACHVAIGVSEESHGDHIGDHCHAHDHFASKRYCFVQIGLGVVHLGIHRDPNVAALVSAAEAAVDADFPVFGAGDAVVHGVIVVHLPPKEIAVVLLVFLESAPVISKCMMVFGMIFLSFSYENALLIHYLNR